MCDPPHKRKNSSGLGQCVRGCSRFSPKAPVRRHARQPRMRGSAQRSRRAAPSRELGPRMPIWNVLATVSSPTASRMLLIRPRDRRWPSATAACAHRADVVDEMPSGSVIVLAVYRGPARAEVARSRRGQPQSDPRPGRGVQPTSAPSLATPIMRCAVGVEDDVIACAWPSPSQARFRAPLPLVARAPLLDDVRPLRRR